MSQTKEGAKKWRANMVARYGSEEAFKEEMRNRAALSKRNKGGKGGFASLTPEEHVEASRRGGLKGKRGRTQEV